MKFEVYCIFLTKRNLRRRWNSEAREFLYAIYLGRCKGRGSTSLKANIVFYTVEISKQRHIRASKYSRKNTSLMCKPQMTFGRNCYAILLNSFSFLEFLMHKANLSVALHYWWSSHNLFHWWFLHNLIGSLVASCFFEGSTHLCVCLGILLLGGTSVSLL